jgi:glutaredoxin 3
MKAIVWSKYHCPYCDRAKNLLEVNGYQIEERKIGDGFTKEELLESVPTARSVPQIFVNDEYIGGYTDLVKFLNEGVYVNKQTN